MPYWHVLMRTLASILLASLATVSFAEQPSRDSVTQQVYVLRSYVFPKSPGQFHGIFRYDLGTKSYVELAPFYYDNHNTLAPLGATADRIVVQGADYLEFDVTSGRLLRRYASNDASAGLWAFSGTMVTEEQARTLGIESGTYGFPSCSTAITGDPGTPCPPYQFPGYSTPTTRPYSILLRRSLDPADLSLTPVKVLNAANTSAAIALDAPHRQFWLWTENISRQWVTMPIIINSLGIGNPTGTILSAASGSVLSLAFHEPSRSLFELLPDTNGAVLSRVLQQRPTTDLVAAATVIDRTMVSDFTQPIIDSVTAVAVPLPERYLQVIPAIGEAPGANGTFWHSDLWLYNPSSDAIDATIRRVAKPDQTQTQHLAAHASLSIRDVLKTLGGGPSGDGVTTDALVIDAPYRWGAQLSAYSRTYTSGSDGGTYGQSVPAVPSAAGYSNHVRDFRMPSDSFGSTIVLDKSDDSRFRHNLGVVNDGATDLGISIFDGYGPKKNFTIAAHSVGTLNLEAVFGDPNALLFAADRPVPVWLSMIDNITGDATFIPFTVFAMFADTTGEMAIPAVGTTHGAGGTSWRTDLYGSFPTVIPNEPLLSPMAHLDASGGCTADVRLNVDRSFIYRDVARQFAACDSGNGVVGAMRMRGVSWMQGYSRTYTTRADGGTFGDMLPFYPTNGWPVQHFSGIEVGSRFRVNVGLYNGQSTTTTNRLLLYDTNGVLVAQRDVDLASHISMQAPIASLMNIANLPAGLYGLSVVPVGEGRSWAYVSLVDNISGDPTNLW